MPIYEYRCENGHHFDVMQKMTDGPVTECQECGAPVQRIVYARNEANYCATCQTGGRLLSDRALSRLLKQDWPRTVEDMERRKERQRIAD